MRSFLKTVEVIDNIVVFRGERSVLWFLVNRQKLLSDRYLLGKWGERQAEKYLERKGYHTLTKNYSCKTGEIDLVMTNSQKTVVFVEVKTRADESFVRIEGAIGSVKKQRLSRAVRYFVQHYKLGDRPLRIDFVFVLLGRGKKAVVKHYENAMTP